MGWYKREETLSGCSRIFWSVVWGQQVSNLVIPKQQQWLLVNSWYLQGLWGPWTPTNSLKQLNKTKPWSKARRKVVSKDPTRPHQPGCSLGSKENWGTEECWSPNSETTLVIHTESIRKLLWSLKSGFRNSEIYHTERYRDFACFGHFIFILLLIQNIF